MNLLHKVGLQVGIRVFVVLLGNFDDRLEVQHHEVAQRLHLRGEGHKTFEHLAHFRAIKRGNQILTSCANFFARFGLGLPYLVPEPALLLQEFEFLGREE